MDSKKAECCGANREKACACTNRFTCSPCLVLWGAALLVILFQYFSR